MCDFGGPSGAEEGAQGQIADFSRTLNANYQTIFGEQQGTIGRLNSVLSQIQSGETGPGFGGAENAALISKIQNEGAAQARNVTQAVQDRTAGQVFNGMTDSSGLARTSAINKQIQEQAASAAATSTAQQLAAETAANYGQGRRNAETTASGLASLAGLENPNAAAGATIEANKQAFDQADKIQQEKVAQTQGIIGAVTGAGLEALTGGLSNIGSPGGGNPFKQFLSGTVGL